MQPCFTPDPTLKVGPAPDGIQWKLNSRLHDLDYADDLVLLSHSYDGIRNKLEKLANTAATVGLKINIKKTKAMRINANNITPIIFNGNSIEEVEEFEYLGCLISKIGVMDIDVGNRINKARYAYYALNKIWGSTFLDRNLRIRIFKACVMSVLLYGCETWGGTHCAKHQQTTVLYLSK